MSIQSQVLKVGSHRGVKRVWLDNDQLLKTSNFYPGKLYQSEYFVETRKIVLTISNEGRKVSKKGEKSIIDLLSKKVYFTLGKEAKQVKVSYHTNKIIIERI